jgi:hypothetical protein
MTSLLPSSQPIVHLFVMLQLFRWCDQQMDIHADDETASST